MIIMTAFAESDLILVGLLLIFYDQTRHFQAVLQCNFSLKRTESGAAGGRSRRSRWASAQPARLS